MLDQVDGNLSNSTVFNISKTSNAQPNGYNYPVSVLCLQGINPKPVAILLHGNGGAGSGMISQYSNLLNDHILIAPSGYGNSWNITEETSDLPDIDFLRDLILQLKGFPNVNTSHIRVLGSSNGAALANRVFVEIDDPSIDLIVPVVSQMHSGSYRNGQFYRPTSEQNTGAAHGVNKGYETLKVPVTGRKILAITNSNDPLIPYTGGTALGTNFLHSQLSAYAMAVSQGYTGSQIADANGVLVSTGIYRYSYLNDRVVHIKGNANHGTNPDINGIIKAFFNLPPKAFNLSVSGTLSVPNTLTGNHSYSDYEGNTEGTVFFMVQEDDNVSDMNDTLISGATSQTTHYNLLMPENISFYGSFLLLQLVQPMDMLFKVLLLLSVQFPNTPPSNLTAGSLSVAENQPVATLGVISLPILMPILL